MKLAHKGRPVSPPRRSPTWLRPASGLVAAVAVLALLRLFLFEIRPVGGNSMSPTLHDGEWVLIATSTYALREPRYGELAVCTPEAATDAWIKRVVGLPGDVLRAEDGVLYRNNQPVSEPYLNEITPTFSAIKSWQEEYLLLGDHRAGSSDSRLPVIGAIPRQQLRGHAVAVVWPPSAWRFL